MTASTNAKTFAVSTAAHARHLLALAVKRLATQEAAVVATQAQIAEYENLAATLPESVAASPAKREQFAVGTEVSFNYGRAASRVVKVGVITATKVEDGVIVQYRVETGEGFDAESFRVFPGQITKAAGVEQEQVQEPESFDAEDESDPLNS